MEKAQSSSFLQNGTECISLLDELQSIWNDVGESEVEQDVLLLELEKACLEIYRRKVDQANRHRAQLRQAIADAEAEIATLCSALGEIPVHCRQNDRSLKEEIKVIIPQLEDLRERKNERLSQFLEVLETIRSVSTEISPEHVLSETAVVDESDLSLKKLEDLYRKLDMVLKEKNDRLRKVMDHLNTLNSLCSVLDIDFKQTACEVHPSLDGPNESKNVSSDTIERLTLAVQRLREVKLQRMHKLQDLVTSMLEMWHLMDTPIEEQQQFQNVTCNIAASEHEITEPNSLSMGFINHVEAEVLRLEQLKSSKMKDLVLRKKIELDDLRRRTHLVPEADNSAEYAIEDIETESLDPSRALEQIEALISIVKEEAYSRKEILERVEKWLSACEDESWLEDYNRDENRYNAGRGTHLMLKRAEKARAVVSKISVIVETLITKIMSWENERRTEFIYDGSRLLFMLEEYTILRQERELERKRQRDQKRIQGQLIAEQEVMFGSKPNPSKSQSAKKLTGSLSGGSTRRQSFGGAALQPTKLDSLPSFKYPSSAQKPDTLCGGTRDAEPQCFFTNTNEGETPRKPFTPLSLPRIAPSTESQSACNDEEENTVPIGSISTPKSPMVMSKPKQITARRDTIEFEDVAAPEREVSFEERRLALLLNS